MGRGDAPADELQRQSEAGVILRRMDTLTLARLFDGSMEGGLSDTNPYRADVDKYCFADTRGVTMFVDITYEL